MRKMLISIVVATMTVGTAAADTINGVWSTKEGCEWKSNFRDPNNKSPENVLDFMYLTDKGIEGYEWGCSFVKSFDGAYGEAVNIASCSAEGNAWPQMMVTKRDKDGWSVSILNDKNEPESVAFPVKCGEK